MRRGAFLLICLFLLPIFSGCISQNSDSETAIDVEDDITKLFNFSKRDTVVGGVLGENLSEIQLMAFKNIIYANRDQINENHTVPQIGGNWTHYFVCSNGDRLEYIFPMPSEFICPDGEILRGEKYETSWVAFRHKQLINNYGLKSALSYHFTGVDSDGYMAKNILLQYAELYPNLPLQNRYGVESDWGGRLTRQSLDEAVLLIDLSWIYHLVKPLLSIEQQGEIESNLLIPMVEVLDTPAYNNPKSLSNWFAFHNAGIAMTAVATDNRSMLNRSLNGSNGLVSLLEQGFRKNALWHEASIAYHNYTISAIAINIEASRALGVNFFDYEWNSSAGEIIHIHQPFITHLNLVRPDGEFPRLDDDIWGMDLGDILNLLEFANKYWPGKVPSDQLKQAREMNDFMSLHSALWRSDIQNEKATLVSVNLDLYGVSVIRNGDIYLLIDYGPHGGWHGHMDKLNIELIGINSTLITDPGTVPYSLPSSHEWYRSSFAHSSAVIGNKSQPETEGSLKLSDNEGNFSLLMAKYTDTESNMEVTRALIVFSLDDGSSVVIDTLNWNGSSSDVVSRTMHFSNAKPIFGENLTSNLPIPEQTKKYVNIGKWDSLDINDQSKIVQFDTGGGWTSYLHIQPDMELYSGTSENEGLMILQSTNNSVFNSTMFAIHHFSPDGVINNSLSIDYETIDGVSIIDVDQYTVSIDWINSLIYYYE